MVLTKSRSGASRCLIIACTLRASRTGAAVTCDAWIGDLVALARRRSQGAELDVYPPTTVRDLVVTMVFLSIALALMAVPHRRRFSWTVMIGWAMLCGGLVVFAVLVN